MTLLNMLFRLSWLMLLIPCLSWASNGDTSFLDNLQVHGFGTLGAAAGNQSNVTALRDLSSSQGVSHFGNPLATDSRLGLQLDAALGHNLSATAQVVGAYRINQSIDSILQWAFVKYQPGPTWSLRLGRFGTDAFLLSDQRNVGFTYLRVRPPVEFYGFLPLYSVDGGDFQYLHPLGDGVLTAKAFWGQSNPYYYIHGSSLAASTTSEQNLRPIMGGDLIWKNDDWILHSAYVTLNVNTSLPGLDPLIQMAQQAGTLYAPTAITAQNITVRDKNIQFLESGLAFDGEHWNVTSELSETLFQSQFKANVASGYVTVGYHLDAWTPFIGYSRVWPTRTVPIANVADAPPQIQSLLSAINISVFQLTNENQYTQSAGVRWDFYNNFDLKAQFDRTVVLGQGDELWATRVGVVPRQSGVNMLSLTLDWVF
ncbi:MAG: hypothetical protein HKM02_03000 [Pseudomonadales bacterium]|nr:hypothetical protein [Pseudomonadales bacterium]